ncbi:MAG: OmpA family protein [Rhodocyclaceae bacterium]|nr:OmpA family protein [Rhodocyclaceae bacterium]
MNKAALYAVLAATALLAACAGPQERVILLPDPDGHVGVIEVRTASGATELTEAYSGARIKGTTTVAEKVGAEEVQRRYGKLLEGLPSPPKRYTLNFEFGSDRLTAQSRAMVPGIQNDLRQFPAPEVVVTGHTDAVGDAAFNDKLSLERANRARDILVTAGIPRDQIQTVGRGSREPLVPVRPGVPEPRNRRVEIKLR